MSQRTVLAAFALPFALGLGACAAPDDDADVLLAEGDVSEAAFALEEPVDEIAADIDEPLEANEEQDRFDAADDDALGESNGSDDVEAQSDGLALSGGNKSRALPNNGATQANKVAAFVAAKCHQEPLLWQPGTATAENIVSNLEGKPALLQAKRPLFVQRKPGVRFAKIGEKKVAYVWVDPDLLGYAGKNEVSNAEIASRFNQSAQRKVGYVVDRADYVAGGKYGEIDLRGWIRASCVHVASAKTKALVKKSYRLPALGADRTAFTVKASCDVRAKYKNAAGANYANYAFRERFKNQRGIYFSFNTPFATYKGRIAGGGMTQGYVVLGETFVRTAKLDDKSIRDPEKEKKVIAVAGGDDREPGVWAYGYTASSDGKREYGYAYQDCLVPAKAAPKAAVGSAPSCEGKSAGYYCDGEDAYYACTASGARLAYPCGSGKKCVSGPDGKAELDGSRAKCE